MGYFVLALQEHPGLAIILALAMGFLIGRLKIGFFNLGIVADTLISGVLIGLLIITLGGLPITLTVSGGALVMGLVFGYRDDHRGASRCPGRGPKQTSGAGLYHTLFSGQHHTDSVGASHRGHDGLRRKDFINHAPGAHKPMKLGMEGRAYEYAWYF